MISGFHQVLLENKMSFSEFIEYVQDQSGLVQEILDNREKKGEAVDRVENLRELLSEAVEFEARRRNPAQTAYSADADAVIKDDPFAGKDTVFDKDLSGILQAYLENAALYSEGDDDDTSEDHVRLLTIHSAKGLEFGAVFLVGAEEGIFPGIRSMDSTDDIEEERRLMYVAITRAKRKFVLITSRSRILFGQTQELLPSRFIREIDTAYLDSIGTRRRMTEAEGYSLGTPDRSYGKPSSQGGPQSARERPFLGAAPSGFSGTRPASTSSSDSAGALTPDEISKGMSVIHPRFGKGTVLSIEKVAGDALVCVEFENRSTKNMLLKQAKLSKA